MPNADPESFQAELALLKEQVTSQLEAHRAEVSAAIEQLARGASSPAGLGAIQLQVREWERRENELARRIAVKTIEYQALRAKAELAGYRQQNQIADLEKVLALRDAENKKLNSLMEALMAEHAQCAVKAAAPEGATPQQQADVDRLKAKLEESEKECAALRHEMENSVALKLARSIPWLLRPLRALFGAKL